MEKNAIGTHRQTLRHNAQDADQARLLVTLDGLQFKLDEVEQGAIARFVTEMRKAVLEARDVVRPEGARAER